MAWDYANGESFYAAPEKVGYWRLAIMAWVASLLWALAYPSLASRFDTTSLESHFSGISALIVSAVQIVLFIFALAPAWLKLLLLTVLLSEMAAAAVRLVLMILAARPFLILSQIGVSGLTGWGRQNVPWWQVTGIHLRDAPAHEGGTLQLVISTSALAHPEGWRAWVMPKPKEGDRVAFITPARESAQVPEIMQQIRHYAPVHLRTIAEPAAA